MQSDIKLEILQVIRRLVANKRLKNILTIYKRISIFTGNYFAPRNSHLDMSNPDDNTPLSEQLPNTLVEKLDALEQPELRTVRKYVEQRLESSHPPLEEQIRDEAEGEVVDIEDQGIYTLVRMRPPAQEESEADSRPISLYHVTQERHPDGEETLHWSFLGDVQE